MEFSGERREQSEVKSMQKEKKVLETKYNKMISSRDIGQLIPASKIQDEIIKIHCKINTILYNINYDE
jgi:hypothetical protein